MTREDWLNAGRMLIALPFVVVMVFTVIVYAGVLFVGWWMYRIASWRPKQ